VAGPEKMTNLKKSLFYCLHIFLIYTLGVSAQDQNNQQQESGNLIRISGKLPPIVKERGKPYLVTSMITVKAGELVKIEKGVILLFKNFTGIEVKGNIWVQGTQSEPVIFTSENNHVYNPKASNEPAPFDWDGITLHATGSKNVFEHCLIEFSLFGIKSETENIVLKECSFDQNGNTDFTVNGQEQLITAFSYNYNADDFEGDLHLDITPEPQAKSKPQTEEETQIEPESQIEQESKPKVDLKPPKAKRKDRKVALTPDGFNEKKSEKRYGKVTVSLLGVGTLLAGGVFGVIETKKYLRAKDDFDKLNEVTHENKMNVNIIHQWQGAKDNVNLHVTYMSTGYGIALLGLTVFTITLFF
jgi:hypothetical protein